jgi:apolipoprotein N-acyltransferase
VITKTVDPDGRTQATLVADVPLGSGRSPWVSFGNWFGWATVAGAGAFVVVGVLHRRRARSRRT